MRRLITGLVIIVVILAAIAAGAAYFGWQRVNEPFRGYQGTEVFVEIPPGIGPAAIGQRLIEAGIVRDELTFRGALWISGRARELKAGEYKFDTPMTAVEVIGKIARGDVYRQTITFREGLIIPEMARVYEEAGLGRAADFEKAAGETSAIRAIDPEATTLEGYLFPETYTLGRQSPAPELVTLMTSQFKRTFGPALQEAAKARGLSVREAVTLASLIEKETAVPEERALVSAVYHNRQKIGMPMQADPTVIYALQHAGRYDGNLRREDLQFDSPYNTYRHAGLPPGPIAAPGKASLEAAVNPAQVDYLYFVSRNDGSHVFARTLDEHNRNVQQWQVRFFRERRRNGS